MTIQPSLLHDWREPSVLSRNACLPLLSLIPSTLVARIELRVSTTFFAPPPCADECRLLFVPFLPRMAFRPLYTSSLFIDFLPGLVGASCSELCCRKRRIGGLVILRCLLMPVVMDVIIIICGEQWRRFY
ncbi:hypothetical protein MRB53_040381 [Persea americana]|nr:hypothetical protein MRB53_040381 [Persea americana]